MSRETESKGKCLYCNKEFSKSTITRHLNTHLSEKIQQGKPGKSFHMKVTTNPKWGSSPYFLNLWVDGNALMDDIDDFLRRIWLECCGHMSGFSKKIKQKERGGWNFLEIAALSPEKRLKAFEKLMEDDNGEISMSKKAKDALQKNLVIDYDYDYGSTTKLQLTVAEEFPVKADAPVVLLSRNEPPEIMCDACEKEPAIVICTECSWHGDSMFCKKCAAKHAKKCSGFADYASLPLVNSPRAGVCGYEGGSIDKERDGTFVKK